MHNKMARNLGHTSPTKQKHKNPHSIAYEGTTSNRGILPQNQINKMNYFANVQNSH
jgi:hypothetical protein